MEFTFIGAGNVATFFAKQIKHYGYSVNQIYSRHLNNAIRLSNLVDAKPVCQIKDIDQSSDVYIIAVRDEVLPEITKALFLPGKLVLHTSGFSSSETLSSVSDFFGVIWPMRMIRENTSIHQPINVVIHGNTAMVIQKIKDLFNDFPWQLEIANDEKRRKMHLIAAFTSNFSNHLYTLAYEYCIKEDIPFQSFYSIIEQTATSIQLDIPANLQSGPAFRKDTSMIKAHETFLIEYTSILQLYKLFTSLIDKKYH